MALKQKTDQTENLRQAIKSFRDAIDAISSPLSSGLESMLQMEMLSGDFNVRLPLAGFTPFDGLESEADIDMGNNAANGKLRKQCPNTGSERNKPAQSRGEIFQERSRVALVADEQYKQIESRGDIPERLSRVAPVADERCKPIESRGDIPERLSEVSPVADERSKPIESRGDIPERLSGVPQVADQRYKPTQPRGEITPEKCVTADSLNSSQIRKQNPGAVENTLAAVGNLVEQILDDERQIHAEQENVDPGSKRQSFADTPSGGVSGGVPGGVPENKVPGHTGQCNHLQKKNRQTGSHHGVTEGPLPGKLPFTISQIKDNNAKATANNSDGSKPLSNCLARVGILADEILRFPATGNKTDANVRADNLSGQVGNDLTARADIVPGAGEFDGKPGMKFQHPKGAFLPKKICNVTEVVLNDSMPANSLDKDAITTLVNGVLVEQARRHGVDLS